MQEAVKNPAFLPSGETRPVLLYFYRPDCKPCQLMEALLERVSFDACTKVVLVKKDIETAPHLITDLQLEVLPTLVLFKKGQEVWRGHNPESLGELRTLF